jgi:hypothetical protein
VCGMDGLAIFADLHRRGIFSETMLYDFDLWRSEARACGRFPSPIGRGSSQSSSAGAV